MTRQSRESSVATTSPRRTAFTLVELVIVVLIIAIMSAVGVPRFASTLEVHRAKAAATRVKADLDLARSRAKMKSVDQTVVFTTSSDSYTLIGVADMNRAANTYTVDLSRYPYNAVLTDADFNGNGTVVFNGFGIPDSTGLVTIQVGSDIRTVSLDANGRSTVP